MKRQYYAWVTVLPTVWLLVCTLTAGLQKVISGNPAIGFISHAWKFNDAVSSGKVLAPAKSITEMQRIIFNDYLDTTLVILFVAVMVAVVFYGLISVRKALTNPNVTAVEIGAAAPAVEGVHA